MKKENSSKSQITKNGKAISRGQSGTSNAKKGKKQDQGTTKDEIALSDAIDEYEE